jgi:hypothetical protein
MKDEPRKSSKRVLEPDERISEVLFGLIMVLTFTGSLSVAEAGREDVRVMLIGALGCNVAWGIIDGILYLMGCLAEKGRNLMTYRAVRRTEDPAKARELISEALPPVIASVMRTEELTAIHQRVRELPEPTGRARLDSTDGWGAAGVFLWVFLTTFPVAVPFIFLQNVKTGMRASNAIAVTMLFFAGMAYGRCVGRSPWTFGISMVALGGVLVALTIALGG